MNAVRTLLDENTLVSADEFFPRFAWAVPTAFASSLDQCHFERGDVFYDSPKAYQRWDETLKHITYSIQVTFPQRSTGKTSKTKDVFSDNWHSEIRFEVINHKTAERRKVTSKHGRLYTMLWHGNWDVFDTATAPEIPLTCLDRSIAKLAETVAATVRPRLPSAGRSNLYVMAYDPTHSISATKYEAVKQQLNRDFSVAEESFAPSDAGLKDALIVPTVSFVAFTIKGDAEKISAALKKALYTRTAERVTDEDRFNIKVHGCFLHASSLDRNSASPTAPVGI